MNVLEDKKNKKLNLEASMESIGAGGELRQNRTWVHHGVKLESPVFGVSY